MSETTSDRRIEQIKRTTQRVTPVHVGEWALSVHHDPADCVVIAPADLAWLTDRLAEAEGALARVPSCVWHGHGGYPESCWWCALNLAALVSPAEPGEGGEA